jgi:hypothetical protein
LKIVERGAQGEAEDILRPRTAAEEWLEQRGIEQWGTGEVSLADVRGQIDRGEWYIVRATTADRASERSAGETSTALCSAPCS